MALIVYRFNFQAGSAHRCAISMQIQVTQPVQLWSQLSLATSIEKRMVYCP
jgi:hypothetical protein